MKGMQGIHARAWAGAALLAASLGGCGGYDPPENAEPGETVTAVPGDSAAVPGAEQPGPQFDND